MISRRYSILAILFVAYLLCYLDRMAIATAIPFIAAEFQLSPLVMGGVLSAFFAGYAAMQIPGGLLADRFGPNRVITVSIVCWSIFTALTGAAGSLTALLVIRVLFGLSEGPFAPAASKAIAIWFPPHEVGRANGIQLAGVKVGAAVAPLVVAPLILGWGWRSVFYALLVPGLILALIVWAYVKDSPPREEQLERSEAGSTTRFSFKHALRVPAVVWCAVTIFFVNIAGWGLMSWLPTYLLQARGFSVTQMGVSASLPFVTGAIGYYVGGHLSDKYFNLRRHVPIVAGLIISSVLVYLAAVAPTGELAVAALTTAFLFLYIASAGLLTLPLILVPRQTVGGVFAIVNTVGQIAAFISPLLVGYVLNVTGSNFTLVFYGFVGLYIAGACTATRIRRPVADNQMNVLSGDSANA